MQRDSGRPKTLFIETRAKALKDFYISRRDVEEHGHTKGGGGCSSLVRGMGRQPHSEPCRNRFKGLLRDGAKVKHHEIRRKEFEEREGYGEGKGREEGDEKENGLRGGGGGEASDGEAIGD